MKSFDHARDSTTTLFDGGWMYFRLEPPKVLRLGHE